LKGETIIKFYAARKWKRFYLLQGEVDCGEKMSKRGAFICIEGLDGAGKTTHAKLLVEKLRGAGVPARYTKEPSEGSIGRLIRRFVLDREKRVNPVVEALLFAADRIDHIEREIEPALKMGEVVVSDRYLYSSLAYQGAVGLDLDWVKEINRFALKPDVAIYIDVPVEVAVKRLRGKRSVMEKIENQKAVRKLYLGMVESGVLSLIDGNRDKKDVSQEIYELVCKLIKID